MSYEDARARILRKWHNEEVIARNSYREAIRRMEKELEEKLALARRQKRAELAKLARDHGRRLPVY